MFVTSAAKVTVPGIFDLSEVRDDDGLRLPNLGLGQPDVDGQVYVRGEPELGLAVGMRHVYVDTRLLAGEEEQSELPVADDGGCHGRTVADEVGCAA